MHHQRVLLVRPGRKPDDPPSPNPHRSGGPLHDRHAGRPGLHGHVFRPGSGQPPLRQGRRHHRDHPGHRRWLLDDRDGHVRLCPPGVVLGLLLHGPLLRSVADGGRPGGLGRRILADVDQPDRPRHPRGGRRQEGPGDRPLADGGRRGIPGRGLLHGVGLGPGREPRDLHAIERGHTGHGDRVVRGPEPAGGGGAGGGERQRHQQRQALVGTVVGSCSGGRQCSGGSTGRAAQRNKKQCEGCTPSQRGRGGRAAEEGTCRRQPRTVTTSTFVEK
mmetsp:Transcript_12039/g.25463  ORF Transcript_12039/g.25463 Transcript_12039/m.25463 type:complete len:274 (-) Transcript_12039:19-840(-)